MKPPALQKAANVTMPIKETTDALGNLCLLEIGMKAACSPTQAMYP
jgi:hypothetical protein